MREIRTTCFASIKADHVEAPREEVLRQGRPDEADANQSDRLALGIRRLVREVSRSLHGLLLPEVPVLRKGRLGRR
jgi:hypothetical protein